MAETTSSSPKDIPNCPLIALPAELRVQIWEQALCPTGTLLLTTTKNKRHAIVPVVSPALLSVNRQIHAETASLLLSNEICLTLDAHDTCWPVIAETRLPQPVLERLKHVFFILDCTSNFRADYEDVDFTAVEALISLKSLRLAVIYDEKSGLGDYFPEFNTMTEILSRVPASTEVVCGVEEGSTQAECLAEVMQKRQMPVSQFTNGSGQLRSVVQQRVIKAIGHVVLNSAVRAVDAELRGSRSGRSRDVFSAYRAKRGRRFGSGSQPDFQLDFAI